LTRQTTVRRIPTPWYLPVPRSVLVDAGSVGQPTTAAWPAANRALYIPFKLPQTVLLGSVSFFTAASAGNFDAAIYDSACATQLVAQGSAAASTGKNTWTLTTPYLLEAGTRYYLGLVCSSTSTTALRYIGQSAQAQRLAGYAQEAAALPLPATATPAQFATAYIPVVFFDFIQ
jgi:hypothetical protein